MEEWARGIVWDCRRECCAPLNFEAPARSDLNLDFLRGTLHSYPDQTLVSYLVEGARLDADVELQTVLVPHLTSLPNGLASVGRELRRLRGLKWYTFVARQPFVPAYFNGQGAVARRLEPSRYRRSTEGGGPRSHTADASGLAAISINAASHIHHIPQHFLADHRPEFIAWIAARGLTAAWEAASSAAPAPAAEEPRGRAPADSPSHAASKWPKESKPTVEEAMRAIAVLRRAAEVLSEPIYIFGDDAKDYFNQLAMATSELWKLNVVFLAEADDLEGVKAGDLVFISEMRLGFGTHGASNIAQRFSDALLAIFRDGMDEAEQAAAGSPSPPMRGWLATRRTVLEPGEAPTHHTRRWRAPSDTAGSIEVRPQQRLYSALMYTVRPICRHCRALPALLSTRPQHS